jgi:hypothetical protein
MIISVLALSTLRMGVGASLLMMPQFSATVFMVPYASAAALPCRLAGIRDFVLGLLLYTSQQEQTAPMSKPVRVAAAESPLLGDNNGNNNNNNNNKNNDINQSTAAATSASLFSDEPKRALLAGLAVDAIDIGSAIWCYLDGTLPAEGLYMIVGGPLSFVGLGLYSWYQTRPAFYSN